MIELNILYHTALSTEKGFAFFALHLILQPCVKILLKILTNIVIQYKKSISYLGKEYSSIKVVTKIYSFLMFSSASTIGTLCLFDFVPTDSRNW